MKEHNELVRFKNSFISDPKKKEELASIINEDVASVVKDKIKGLIQLHRRVTLDSGYSQMLSYRIITICAINKYNTQLNLMDQISRFFNFCLANCSFQRIQLCFDLLLIKQIQELLKEERTRMLKIRLLRGLRVHYRRQGRAEQSRMCAHTLRQYCRQSLQRDCVKNTHQIYEQVLDALIAEVKNRVGHLSVKGKGIVAIEQLSVFVGLLEKSQMVVSSKYQRELMEGYWALAKLHDGLHYLAYARKYAGIAFNIAMRIEDKEASGELRRMLDFFV